MELVVAALLDKFSSLLHYRFGQSWPRCTMSIFSELKRRNVFRVAAAYVVAAWLVIQVVETIFPAFGFGAAAIRNVVIFLAIGLIPTLIVSWAFELTPEGLRKEKDVSVRESIAPQTGKKLDRIIMVVLALALGYFALDKFVLSESRTALMQQVARQEGRSQALVESFGDQSIAVMPFLDMSAEKDQEYLSDGIAEELLNLLARIPELRVISRSSAFSYKGKDVKTVDIARELNVAHILDGSVRKSGNQVRITAQLIQARSDTAVWSETYDRSLEDIFAIQDEIASRVVNELRIKLLGETPQARETDPAAYLLFLKGRDLRRQTSSDSLIRSQDALQRALAIDPDFVPALDDLVSVYINQAHTGDREFKEGYEMARALTLRGLEIDPQFGRLYVQLAWIKMYYDGDLQAAADLLERGLALAPGDVSSLGDAATFLYVTGRVDDSILLSQYVIERDPFHPVPRVNCGTSLMSAGRFQEAASQIRRALALSPGYSGAQFLLAEALVLAGDQQAALPEAEKETSDGYRLTGLAIVHHALGNPGKSNEAMQILIDDYAAEWSLAIAQVFAFRGERDAAFDWIETAVEQGNPELGEINVNPLFKNLYDDPRWPELLQRLGKSPEQLSQIKFEVALPEPG